MFVFIQISTIIIIMADLRKYNLVEIKTTFFSKDIKKGKSKVPIQAVIIDVKPKVLLTFLNINLLNKETPFIAYLPVGEEITITVEFNNPFYGPLIEKKTFKVEDKPQTVEITFVPPKFPGTASPKPTIDFPKPKPPEPPEDTEDDGGKGEIEGIVLDETKKPIQGASVKIRNWPEATTNKDGFFKINIQPKGTGYLRVVATKNGYAPGGATTKYIQKESDSDFVEIELKRKDKKRVKLPKIGKPVPISNFIGLLIALLIGIIISAILGSVFLFFGFLCLAIHFLLPSAADTETFRYAMVLAKKDAYRKIKQIRNDGSLSDEEKERRIARLVKQVKDSTAAEAIVAKTPALKLAISPVAILKHVLKALGIALFIWGLASLNLPFAKLLALAGAFVGYFYIGGQKEPEEK